MNKTTVTSSAAHSACEDLKNAIIRLLYPVTSSQIPEYSDFLEIIQV
jgi:hypothetical protein